MAEKRKSSSFEREEIRDFKKARIIEAPIKHETIINIVHTIVLTLLLIFGTPNSNFSE